MITNLNDLYFSNVDTKLEISLKLFHENKTTFAADDLLKKELTCLDKLVAHLQNQMETMAMFRLCAECGSKSEGGCCSSFMAGETDSIQLLINLLLGVEVEFQRNDGFECFYLGKKGCIFKAKPMFCLNYNCSAIYEKSPKAEITNLDKAAGAVLHQQYKIEQNLLQSLNL